MQIHWLAIVGFALAIVALTIFLIKQNQKDKKDLVDKLNRDYKKPTEHEPSDRNAT